MSTGEIIMWILGGVGAMIVAALIRLRDVLHKIDVRVAKIETKLGINGK